MVNVPLVLDNCCQNSTKLGDSYLAARPVYWGYTGHTSSHRNRRLVAPGPLESLDPAEDPLPPGGG